MRRHFISSIIVLACLTLGAATTARAQSTRRFVITIPFHFVIGGRRLPPGKYEVERIDPTKPNVVFFKNTDNGMVRLFLTLRVEKDETSTASCLMFKLRRGEFHLFQLWMLGYKDGNQVPPADEKERHDQRGNNSALVRLTGNNQKP